MLRARAFLFDLDGVLADSTANVERHWTAFARRHALDPADVLHVVHGRRAIDTIRALLPDVDVEAEHRWLEAAESTDTAGITALPGAAAVLAALPRERWAVVTSGTRAVALARLRAADLPLPPLLIAAEDLLRGKPDPEGYLRAAAELGVPPAECIVVEDAAAGAAAARAGGMQLVVLTTTYPASILEPAALIVPSLAALTIRIEQDERGGALLVRRC